MPPRRDQMTDVPAIGERQLEMGKRNEHFAQLSQNPLWDYVNHRLCALKY